MYHFFSNHKKTLFGILFLILFGTTVSLATPPTPQTLDPDCLPTDPSCTVSVNVWNKSGTTLSYTDGLVGIGTTTPDSTLHVAGEIRGNNLVITGDSATVAQATQAQAAINYGVGSGYPANRYTHNYRIYSYKDTDDGRIYSSTYATLSAPTGTAPDAPTDVQATQSCTNGCNYQANSWEHNYRVYSYKIVEDQRIYSSTYATLPSNFVDDNSGDGYDITVLWTPSANADGYRILLYDPSYNGYNYDAGYDTANTSFVDDGCGNVCFNGNKTSVESGGITDNNSTDTYTITLSWNAVAGADGYRVLKYDLEYNGYNYDAGYDTTDTTLTDDNCDYTCFNGGTSAVVTPTERYTNAASINGQLSLTGPLLLNSQTFSANSTRNYVLGESTGVGSNNTFFVGYAAGAGTTTVVNANFLGQGAGQGATNTSNANFFGLGAGAGATSASNSNFFGNTAGQLATNASNSNFLGSYAGYQATSASNSNFFGSNAGQGATFASYSNFLGSYAGYQATSASNSNFFGNSAGNGAVQARDANFFGTAAGSGATGAAYSNFFGPSAGSYATNASNSIFIGRNAGINDTVNNTSNGLSSILIGSYTNTGGYSNSILLGSGTSSSAIANTQANQFMLAPTITNARFRGVDYTFPSAQASASGQVLTNNGSGGLSWQGAVSLDSNNSLIVGGGSTSVYNSNFFGPSAGSGATDASYSNFFGQQAGQNATSGSFSNFFGWQAGKSATNANSSNFFGSNAGNNATNANSSNFFGPSTGAGATNANNSNFFGVNAGNNATNAARSNFFGQGAGQNATSASYSNFIGYFAGLSATDASFSNLFGYQVGVSNGPGIGANNIIIGTNISLGNAVANSINIGGVLFGSGSYATTTGTPSIAAVTTGKIGIATNALTYTLNVGNGSVSGIVASFQNGNGTCTINPNTTSLSCSSDRNLKKDIVALDTSILNKVLSLQPVTYHWNSESDTDSTHAGFIAQDVEAIFPDLVSTDPNTGLKSLAYTGLIPYTVKAIQDINFTITTLPDTTKANTLRDGLIAWFGDVNNGIQQLFVKQVNTDKLCVGATCVTEDQLQKLLQNQSTLPQQAPIPQVQESIDTPSIPIVDTAPESIESTESLIE